MRPSTPIPLAAALAEPSVTKITLAELYFDSGTVYLVDAPHDVEWNGQTYSAAQGLASVEPITETPSGAAGIAFTMPLIGDASVVSVLTTPLQGRRVILRTAVLVGLDLEVGVEWDGTLDVAIMNLAAAQPSVRVTSEHAMRRWSVAVGTKLSDADHQRRYPGDRFFEHVDKMAEVTLQWPRAEFFKR